MTVMPIATPTAPPAATSTTPSDDGSAFADVMEHHLGGSGLSREAANAVLDEAASPSVAPSDGLAAVVARMVGTAGAGSLGAGSLGARSLGTGATAEAAAGGEPDVRATAEGGAAAVPAVPAAVALGAAAPDTQATAAVVGAATPGSEATAVVPGAATSAGEGTVSPNGAAVPVAVAPSRRDAVGQANAATTSGVPNGQPMIAEAANAPATSGLAESATGDHAVLPGMVAETHGQSNDTRPPGTAGDRAALAGASATAGTIGVTASTAASGSPIGKSADGVRGAAVTDQVFDHVTRLVSRGDGTHRLMLKLHPADLGEVQVVLTVKNGTVDVTLSAGAAAREALREGSPQLRALLELTGATTGQVVVRDLGGGVATAVSQQQAHGFGADSQRQPADAGTEANGDPAGGQDGLGDASADAETDGRSDGSSASTDRGESHVPGGRGNTEVRDGAGAGARRTSAHDAAPAAPDLVGSVRVDLNL